MAVPKRNLSQLLKFYNLEPEIRDLFVEGPTDKAVYLHISQGYRPFGSSVHSISDIEIDVGDFDGTDGAKGRVRHVANIASEVPDFCITGLVDRNLDARTLPNSQNSLMVTEYADLEFHLASFEKIGQFVGLSLAHELHACTVDLSVTVANYLYAIRQHARAVGISEVLVEVQNDCFELGGAQTKFLLQKYLEKMDSYHKTKKLWINAVPQIQSIFDLNLANDPNYIVNFHEYESVLRRIILKFTWKNAVLEDYWLGKLVRAQIVNSKLEGLFFDILRERVTS